MNIKRVAMMLTIMLITILSASSFYVITGEANSGGIRVNSSSSTIRSGDYEKVPDENGPYGTEEHKYYIRYTGAKSHRTTVDLEDTNVIKDGKNLGGCGLTIGNDGYPYIFEQKITSTYKMFSNNDSITRVFVPASIAITSANDTSNTYSYKGIASNMFDGCKQSLIDMIYHTGNMNNTDLGKDLTSAYDKTGIITQTNVNSYCYLEPENFSRPEVNDLKRTDTNGLAVNNGYTYQGDIKNLFVSKKIDDIQNLFSNASNFNANFKAILPRHVSKPICKVLLDEEGTWTDIRYLFANNTSLKLPENFTIPSTVENMANTFANCIDSFPSGFTIPNGVKNLAGTFSANPKLKGIFTIPYGVENMYVCFNGSGDNATNLASYRTPIVMRYYSNCRVAVNYTANVYPTYSSGKVTKVSLGAYTAQSLDDSSRAVAINDVGSMQDNTNRIVIEDGTNWVKVTVHNKGIDGIQDTSDKVVIEDETEPVIITVNKKSVDETQQTNQSTESIEENKFEEDEVQE